MDERKFQSEITTCIQSCDVQRTIQLYHIVNTAYKEELIYRILDISWYMDIYSMGRKVPYDRIHGMFMYTRDYPTMIDHLRRLYVLQHAGSYYPYPVEYDPHRWLNQSYHLKQMLDEMREDKFLSEDNPSSFARFLIKDPLFDPRVLYRIRDYMSSLNVQFYTYQLNLLSVLISELTTYSPAKLYVLMLGFFSFPELPIDNALMMFHSGLILKDWKIDILLSFYFAGNIKLIEYFSRLIIPPRTFRGCYLIARLLGYGYCYTYSELHGGIRINETPYDLSLYHTIKVDINPCSETIGLLLSPELNNVLFSKQRSNYEISSMIMYKNNDGSIVPFESFIAELHGQIIINFPDSYFNAHIRFFACVGLWICYRRENLDSIAEYFIKIGYYKCIHDDKRNGIRLYDVIYAMFSIYQNLKKHNRWYPPYFHNIKRKRYSMMCAIMLFALLVNDRETISYDELLLRPYNYLMKSTDRNLLYKVVGQIDALIPHWNPK